MAGRPLGYTGQAHVWTEERPLEADNRGLILKLEIIDLRRNT